MEIKKYTDENQVNEIFSKVYPIGSVYISTIATNPNELFGFGTWQQVKDRFLLAAGSTYSAGSTGGSATHKLTINEMPSHEHTYGNNVPTWPTTTQYDGDWGVVYEAKDTSFPYTGWDSTSSSTGGNVAHNNMPPYLVVFIWKRVS